MKKPAQFDGKLTITGSQGGPGWTAYDHAEETRTLRTLVWPAVRQLIAHDFPGLSVVFTADESAICTVCGLVWEELTAEEAADLSTQTDEHSTAGEPVCCAPAVDAFRAERGIPAVDWAVRRP